MESETEPDQDTEIETESLCYGECQCDCEPLTKENKGGGKVIMIMTFHLSEKCSRTQ